MLFLHKYVFLKSIFQIFVALPGQIVPLRFMCAAALSAALAQSFGGGIKKNINLIFSHISLSFCIRLARLHGNEVSIFCIFGRFLSVVALACF